MFVWTMVDWLVHIWRLKPRWLHGQRGGIAQVRALERAIKNVSSQQGGLLLEVVVAMSVFGVLGAAVLSAVQTASITKRSFELDSQAENIIRNQLDSVFEDPYKAPDAADPTYSPITPPPGYTVTAESITYAATSTDISTVRITVIRDGQTVQTYETLRTNW